MTALNFPCLLVCYCGVEFSVVFHRQSHLKFYNTCIGGVCVCGGGGGRRGGTEGGLGER